MTKIFSLLFATLLIASAASAETSIGNGFKCIGTSIYKGSKVVKSSKAKSTLKDTIAALKEAVANAPKGKKKDKAKAKLATAKQSQKNLTACTKGTLDSTQVDPIFSNLASGTGTYTGTYSGIVPIVGQITGGFSIHFSLNGTIFGADLTLDGPLGAATPTPLNFSADLGGLGLPAVFTLSGTFLGNVTLSIGSDGHIVVENDVASKKAKFDGNLAGSTISGTLAGSYSGVSYNGTFTATK